MRKLTLIIIALIFTLTSCYYCDYNNGSKIETRQMSIKIIYTDNTIDTIQYKYEQERGGRKPYIYIYWEKNWSAPQVPILRVGVIPGTDLATYVKRFEILEDKVIE